MGQSFIRLTGFPLFFVLNFYHKCVLEGFVMKNTQLFAERCICPVLFISSRLSNAPRICIMQANMRLKTASSTELSGPTNFSQFCFSSFLSSYSLKPRHSNTTFADRYFFFFFLLLLAAGALHSDLGRKCAARLKKKSQPQDGKITSR